MHSELKILGAGGHGAVVFDAASALGRSLRIYDDNPDRSGSMLLGETVDSPQRQDFKDQHWHVAIGTNLVRRDRAAKLIACGALLDSVAHMASIYSQSARLGEGCFLAAGSVLGPRSTVGMGVIVNHGAVVDHDCSVGDFVHVAPGAVLGGGCEVGADSLIGSNATLLPGVRVGAGATIGAGAVVTRDVRESSVVVGNPARLYRRD